MQNSYLIPVFNGTIHNFPTLLCNARDLYENLKSKREFATWIKDRIETHGFIEGEDFLTILSKTSGRPRKEFHITIGMGKELAMLENNEQGKIARRYFIDCERQLYQQSIENPYFQPELEIDFTCTEIMKKAFGMSRFMLSFDHAGRMQILPIPSNSFIATYAELAKAIRDPSNIGLRVEHIKEIAQACVDTLACRAGRRN